jgi:hypothetical protein
MLYCVDLGFSMRTIPTMRDYSKTDDASLRNVVICITRYQHLYTARLPLGDTRYAHGCCYFHTLRIVRPTALHHLPCSVQPSGPCGCATARSTSATKQHHPPSRYGAHDVKDLHGGLQKLVRRPTSCAALPCRKSLHTPPLSRSTQRCET